MASGLFPVPLAGPQPLAVSALDNTPDVQAIEHPLFYGIPDPVGFVSKINIKQYFAGRGRAGTRRRTRTST